MPSVKNPNVPNKSRRIANRAKVQKSRSKNSISKNPRGTAVSSVLFPNSGKYAPLSGKKARKVAKAQNFAAMRVLEKERERLELEGEGKGEVQMKDVQQVTKGEEKKTDEEMSGVVE